MTAAIRKVIDPTRSRALVVSLFFHDKERLQKILTNGITFRKIFDRCNNIGVLDATQLVKVFFVCLPERNGATLDHSNCTIPRQVVAGLIQIGTSYTMQAFKTIPTHRKTERRSHLGVLRDIRHGSRPVVLSRNRESTRATAVTGMIQATVRVTIVGIIIETHGIAGRTAFGSVVF